MKKTEIYVKVENKKQAKKYKAILKALGEKINYEYWIDDSIVKQDKLVFEGNRWFVFGYDARNRKEITIKELIKILINE